MAINNGHLYRWDWGYNVGDTVGHGIWTQIATTKYKGPWDPGFEYEPWDIVLGLHNIILGGETYSNPATFMCLTKHIGQQPPGDDSGDAYWVVLGIQLVNT